MAVKFRVGTFGQELFTGTVEAVRLNASNNNSVVTYPVWIRCRTTTCGCARG